MSLELFGYKSVKEKVDREKQWVKNNFSDCPIHYDPEASWRENAVVCRLSVLLPYCNYFGIYQILNQEFNDALAAEIIETGLSPVLAVGAGCGELAAVLEKRGIDIYAVDNSSESLPRNLTRSREQPLQTNYRSAIDKFKPELIICSWMAEESDWIKDFTLSGSVKACILIGEDNKRTDTDFAGWPSEVLKGSNKWSLCRLDHGVDFERPELWWRHSKVVIFRNALVQG
ncbi:hypothetical protein SAMN05660649_01824 [Desulfotomaculum arcticum]|uniref:Methyltransferase domain-containing protein n=1 Tax=Desulfotruncus arcticus DSM 17038 TaxID=1121424 RepID=A0A1I2SEK4_9FIRM|nr:hypothetical protein [Desulfotruncus arcticus]SFG49317.1 hypothetical protein SAMN05660649_01824 [Desulfotomaculum arcticum] [Desulfotruncus arcticus DSM 17038]